jgi:epoxyqueuosine reductase QueG
LNGLVEKKFREYPYAISIAKRLDDAIINTINQGPTKEYFEHYNEINHELAQKANQIKKELKKIRIDSIAVKPTLSTESKTHKKYLQTLTVDISHKMVATRAGLGWIGKTDLFISPRFGPRLRLVSILINKKPDQIGVPIEKSRCGTCHICVEKCPAQAATGKLWNINIHRDQFFDAFRCREMCGYLAKQRLHTDQRICGICVSVCPVGMKSRNIPENLPNNV